eukprot:TRINITY_DN9728_c0_g1_i1.p1 TRINITY_DN9728_c0_g1~~TRINITY_DN9728_c0_g1_i1.p1  ORF type:complete len:216 (-),score=35.76 TRINITY_DN9728_c0_g1_i1:227-874(-)
MTVAEEIAEGMRAFDTVVQEWDEIEAVDKEAFDGIQDRLFKPFNTMLQKGCQSNTNVSKDCATWRASMERRMAVLQDVVTRAEEQVALAEHCNSAELPTLIEQLQHDIEARNVELQAAEDTDRQLQSADDEVKRLTELVNDEQRELAAAEERYLQLRSKVSLYAHISKINWKEGSDSAHACGEILGDSMGVQQFSMDSDSSRQQEVAEALWKFMD